MCGERERERRSFINVKCVFDSNIVVDDEDVKDAYVCVWVCVYWHRNATPSSHDVAAARK